MDSTVLAVVITAFPSALAGIAALITAINNRKTSIDEVKKDIKSIKEDVSVTKEASFYALEAHIKKGANGRVRKAWERLNDNIFDNEN